MSNHKLKHTSNQWVATYLHAVSKSWLDDNFKASLLEDAHKVLKELGFHIPENIFIEFREVAGNDYNDFPEINLSIFDHIHTTPIHVTVPIPTKPETLSNSFEDIFSKATPMVGCACFCA